MSDQQLDPAGLEAAAKAPDYEYRLSWECPSAACMMAHQETIWEKLSDEEWGNLPWEKSYRIANGGDIHSQRHTLEGWAEYHYEPVRNVRFERRLRPNPDEGWAEEAIRGATGVTHWKPVAAYLSVQEQPDEPTRMLSEWHDALGDVRGRGNASLRLTLHEEEHEELLDELSDKRLGIPLREPKADKDVDRAKLARELADVVYIAYGTAHAFAIDLDAALREIHRAAMSKLDPATMVVRADGKVLKPEGFVPPDMSRAVRDTEQEPER